MTDKSDRYSIVAPFLLIVVLCFFCSVDSNSAQSSGVDPGIPDTLYIGSDSVANPTQGIIPINLTTDETLAALEITLIHNGSGIIIDSFSFEGSPVANYNSKDAIVNGNNIIIFVFAVAEPPIPAGKFLLGQLYISYSTFPQIVTIDTSTVVVDLIEHNTTFSAASFGSFVPQVDNGTLIITEVCCVGSTGNIDNSNLQTPDIADLTVLIDHLFITLVPLDCPAEANIDGSLDGKIDIADLTFLIDHLFINFPPVAPCQ